MRSLLLALAKRGEELVSLGSVALLKGLRRRSAKVSGKVMGSFVRRSPPL